MAQVVNVACRSARGEHITGRKANSKDSCFAQGFRIDAGIGCWLQHLNGRKCGGTPPPTVIQHLLGLRLTEDFVNLVVGDGDTIEADLVNPIVRADSIVALVAPPEPIAFTIDADVRLDF